MSDRVDCPTRVSFLENHVTSRNVNETVMFGNFATAQKYFVACFAVVLVLCYAILQLDLGRSNAEHNGLQIPDEPETTAETTKSEPHTTKAEPGYKPIIHTVPTENLITNVFEDIFKGKGQSECIANEEEDTSGITGTSGKVFGGAVVNSISAGDRERLLKTSAANENVEFESVGGMTRKPECRRWAVVTTIFKPSNAMGKLMSMPNWCLVIVGDRKTPSSCYHTLVVADDLHQTFYLGVEEQEKLAESLATVGSLPWNHFGRKNIGYLFAIAHGAEQIWDFDDDNPITADNFLHMLDAERVVVTVPSAPGPLYNPMPVMGAPIFPSWPRGFPLDSIKNESTYALDQHKGTIDVRSIGIMQSLAHHDPDVDAIYRLTSGPLPFDFCEVNLAANSVQVIPPGTLTPFNAQATLFNHGMLWATYLPISVHSRVSDIWRSYIVQVLGWHVNQVLAFSEPLVTQFRNPHNHLADLESEGDLYKKSGELAAFLGSEWECPYDTLPECVMDLWISVYEREYIGMKDVELMRNWLDDLHSIGYKFPKWNNKRTSLENHSDYTPNRKVALNKETLGKQCVTTQEDLILSSVVLNDSATKAFLADTGRDKVRVLTAGMWGDINKLKEPFLARWRNNGVRSWAHYLFLRELGFETWYKLKGKANENTKDRYLHVVDNSDEDEIVRMANSGYFDFIVVSDWSIPEAMVVAKFITRIKGARFIFTVCVDKPLQNNQDFQTLYENNDIALVTFNNHLAKLNFDARNSGIPSIVNAFGQTTSIATLEPRKEYIGSFVFVGDVRSQLGYDVFVALAKAFPDYEMLIISAGTFDSKKHKTTESFCELIEQKKYGGYECPPNLQWVKSPKGDPKADQIMATADIALDFSWNPSWIYDNTKVQMYLTYGLPVVTNRPSQTYRWSGLFGNRFEVIGAKESLNPSSWVKAVRRILASPAMNRRHSTSLADFTFSWERHTFELWTAMMSLLDQDLIKVKPRPDPFFTKVRQSQFKLHKGQA
eukprot:Clim_evm49s198 gene=Clim_evmTU49s198